MKTHEEYYWDMWGDTDKYTIAFGDGEAEARLKAEWLADYEAEHENNAHVQELARDYLAALFSGKDWEAAECGGYVAGSKEQASAIVEMLEAAAHGNAAPHLASSLKVVLETITDAPLPNFPTVADIGADGSKPCGHRDTPCSTAESAGIAPNAATLGDCAEMEKLVALAEYWRKDAEQDWKEARERCIEAERNLLEYKDELEALRARNAEEQAALNEKGADFEEEVAGLPAPERAKAEEEQARIMAGKDAENEPQVRHALRIGRIGRMKGGLKQDALARLCGVHKITVSKWERKPENAPIVFDPLKCEDLQYSRDIRRDAHKANIWAHLYREQHGRGARKRVSITKAEGDMARDLYADYAAGIRAVRPA